MVSPPAQANQIQKRGIFRVQLTGDLCEANKQHIDIEEKLNITENNLLAVNLIYCGKIGIRLD